MDKGSDDIRQDIESTRAALDSKLNMLENRAQDAVEKTKEAFDVRVQVEQRPWLMLGASVVAGYILGNMGSDDSSSSRSYDNRSYDSRSYSNQSSYTQNSSNEPSMVDKLREKGADFASQFDDEINMLKSAALTTITTALRDVVKSAVPAMSSQIDRMAANMGASSNYSGSSGYSATPSRSSLSSSTPTSSPGAAMTGRNSATGSGAADYDSIGAMTRVGSPASAPRSSSDASNYYEDASERSDRAIDETRKYSQ